MDNAVFDGDATFAAGEAPLLDGESTVVDGFDTALRPGTAPTGEVLADRPETGERPGTAPTRGESKDLVTVVQGFPAEVEGAGTRPSTAGSIAEIPEFGQESMMNFMQLHMHSILRPFSDSLQQLHNNADSVAGNLRELISKVDANASVASEQGALIDGLRSDLTKSQEFANAIMAHVEKENSKHKTANSALDVKIGKVQDRIPPMQLSIKELWQAIEASRKTILTKHKEDLEEIKTTMDSFLAVHNDLEKAHESTVANVDTQRHIMEKCVKDTRQLFSEAKTFHENIEMANMDIERLQRKCEEISKSSQEAVSKLQQETQLTHDSAVRDISKRLEAQKVLWEDIEHSVKLLETGLADQNQRTVENGENFRKLVKHIEEKRSSDVHRLDGAIDKIEADVLEHARKKASKDDLETQTTATGERIAVAQDDVEFSFRRLTRIEKIMSLHPMKKSDPDVDGGMILKNGMMLTKEMIQNFKDTFSSFDADDSGSIESKEIADVLKSMGHEVTPDLVQMIIEDIDKDHSGEIDFDEFCSLMAKLLGPDGKVDMQSYLKHMSDEARQNRMIELVPVMNEQLKVSQGVIQEVQSQLQVATPRLQNLEGDHLQLANEVQKLRKGLELSQEYWKGFSRGLKETKKSVRQEGASELLPNGSRMPILPPLERQPPVTR